MHERWIRLLLAAALILTTAYQAGVVFGQVDEGATLTVLRGTVALTRTDDSTLQPATSGTIIHAGDHISTVGPAGALITFFAGTEIELGAETTIAIQDVRTNANGVIDVTIENVLGSTVHRVATLTNAGATYQVVAGGTVALVRGTVFGHRVDGQGNVTVYLAESNNDFYFPTPTNLMFPGEVCTYTARGDLFCANAGIRNPDIWNIIANGVFGNPANGTTNEGLSTGSGNVGEQSHTITNGPDRTNRGNEDDVQPNGSNPPTATPTPTSTVTPTPTPTRIPGTTPADVVCTPGPATITVNSKADNNVRDTVLTLREAILIANGSLVFSDLTPQEKAQVRGGCGGTGVADTITFDPAAFAALPAPALADDDPANDAFLRAPLVPSIPLRDGTVPIAPGNPLPALTDPAGTTLIGTGTAGIQGGGTDIGLTLSSSNNSIQNFEVRGFSTGIVIGPGTTNNHIGGPAPAGGSPNGGNLISGNSIGVRIQGSGNFVQTNDIGTNSAGTAAFPNSGVGVQIDEGAANNLIGGSTPGTGNLISGNTTGILIAGGNNTVQGNGIGTNATNTGSIPNGIGVQIGSGVPDITIGGTISGAPGTGPGNIVRGNLTTGIQVAGPRYVIQGNSIIQNGTYGVALLDGACPGLIGTGSKPNVCPNLLLTDVSPDDPSDVATGDDGGMLGVVSSVLRRIPLVGDIGVRGSEGVPLAPPNFSGTNDIASNGVDGIAACPAAACTTVRGNTFRTNSIHDNGASGISIHNHVPDGITQNGVQPPELSGIEFGGFGANRTVTVFGSADCFAGPCVVEIFGNRVDEAQARTPVGTGTVPQNVDGPQSFTFTFPKSRLAPDQQTCGQITATLTLATGDSSEISPPLLLDETNDDFSCSSD